MEAQSDFVEKVNNDEIVGGDDELITDEEGKNGVDVPEKVAEDLDVNEDMNRQQEEDVLLKKPNDMQKIREVNDLEQHSSNEQVVVKPHGENLVEDESMVENAKEQFGAMLEQNRTFMVNNKKLRQLVKELEEQVSSCGKENAELESTNKTLNTQVQELTKLVKELEEDVSSRGKENVELESTNKTLNTQVQELTQLVKELEEDVSSRSKENVELESTNKTLNTQVQELSIQVQDLEEDIATLDTTLKEAVEACDKYAETNESLEAEVDRLNTEKCAKEGENTETNLALKQDIMRLEETINALNEEKETLNAEKKELVNGKNNLYGEVGRIRKVMKTMSEESKRVTETNEKLQMEKEKQTEQLASATEQNKVLEEKLEYLNEKGLQDEIDQILSLGYYLDTQGKKYIVVEEDAETKRDEELNALHKQVTMLQGEKKSLKEMIEDTEVQKNILSEKLNNLNDEKAKVELSIDELRKEKERIETELRLDNHKLRSEFLAMLKDIEEELAAKVKESDAIDEEKEALAEELINITDSKRELEMELHIMESVIDKQVKKIDDLSTKCYLSKDLEDDLQSKTELIEGLYEENDLLRREAEYKNEEAEEMSRKCELWMTLVEERVRAYDLLKNKYNVQRRFVERAYDAIDLERTKKKLMDNEILIALEKLDSVVSTNRSFIRQGWNGNEYDQKKLVKPKYQQLSSSEGNVNNQRPITDRYSTKGQPLSSSSLRCSPNRPYTSTLRPVTPKSWPTIGYGLASERSFTPNRQSTEDRCTTVEQPSTPKQLTIKPSSTPSAMQDRYWTADRTPPIDRLHGIERPTSPERSTLAKHISKLDNSCERQYSKVSDVKPETGKKYSHKPRDKSYSSYPPPSRPLTPSRVINGTIVYHPDNDDVRNIIESVNEMYDNNLRD